MCEYCFLFFRANSQQWDFWILCQILYLFNLLISCQTVSQSSDAILILPGLYEFQVLHNLVSTWYCQFLFQPFQQLCSSISLVLICLFPKVKDVFFFHVLIFYLYIFFGRMFKYLPIFCCILSYLLTGCERFFLRFI